MQKKKTIGGGALFNGVMFISDDKINMAARTEEGLHEKNIAQTRLSKSSKIWSKPILRGLANLYEMMKVHSGSIEWSIALEEGEAKKLTWLEKIIIGLEFIVVFALFGVLPYYLTERIDLVKDNPLAYNLVRKMIFVVVIVAFYWLFSKTKTGLQMFQYHGAEHKVINTYEKGLELTVENVKQQSYIHRRCGTSFIVMLTIKSIIIYAIADYYLALWLGEFPPMITRIVYHTVLLPAVVGISYEFLKLIGKFDTLLPIRMLLSPGLLMQKFITVKEPDNQQIEVALKAIEPLLAEQQA